MTGLPPRSLLGRMLLLTLVAVLLAQALSSAVWLARLRASHQEGLAISVRGLAQSMAGSVAYLRSLPDGYRPMLLDQLRNMGGTRFFVSLNGKPLRMAAMPDTPRKQAVYDTVRNVLRDRLGELELSVRFVRPADLRLFEDDIGLDQLPSSWAHHALTLKPIDPPVLVTQIRIAPDKWLYLASLLPEPYVDPEQPALPLLQLLSVALTTVFLLLFVGLLVRWQSRPLERLARAARELSLEAEGAPLPETGVTEVAEVSRAFNAMRLRISRYLSERSQLFRAISHDLGTPITRLRLRVELLDDDALRDKFSRDLDDLEMLAKGALQCIKDNDIRENVEPIDLNRLLHGLVDPYLAKGRATLEGEAVAPYPGRPLALRRCIGNLLDNALKYGERAHLRVEDDGRRFVLHVDDEGPGVPEDRLEQVFEPSFRLASVQQGYGLGLGIARNIAYSHGAGLTLRNLSGGGLRATLALSRPAAAEPRP